VPKINVYLPDDLADEVRRHQLPVSAICQQALLEEVKRMEATTAAPDFTTLTVDRSRTENFTGYWVVEPSDDQRSSEPEADAGMCYGVARTAKGRVAVYTYHVNDMWPAALSVYDDIDDAVADGLPPDIADEFLAAGGQVVYRDI
jgi:Post-segregation antitoxin CcdA